MVDLLGQQIYISMVFGNDEVGFVFLDWLFQGQVGGDEFQFIGIGKFLIVVVFQFYINDRRKVAIVFCWEVVFVNFEVFDGICIEGVEKVKEMISVVYYSFIKYDEVLVLCFILYKQIGMFFIV